MKQKGRQRRVSQTSELTFVSPIPLFALPNLSVCPRQAGGFGGENADILYLRGTFRPGSGRKAPRFLAFPLAELHPNES